MPPGVPSPCVWAGTLAGGVGPAGTANAAGCRVRRFLQAGPRSFAESPRRHRAFPPSHTPASIGSTSHEAYLPTLEDAACPHARFPRAHEDPWRSRGHQCAPRQGPQAAGRLNHSSRPGAAPDRGMSLPVVAHAPLAHARSTHPQGRLRAPDVGANLVAKRSLRAPPSVVRAGHDCQAALPFQSGRDIHRLATGRDRACG